MGIGEMLVNIKFYFSHNVFKNHCQGCYNSGLNGKMMVNPLPHNAAYRRNIAVENIVRKVKMLVTSNFSFSNNVFYPI